MPVLILLMIITSGVAIYGRRATILGSLPIFIFGLILGGTTTGSNIVGALVHMVDGALAAISRVT